MDRISIRSLQRLDVEEPLGISPSELKYHSLCYLLVLGSEATAKFWV